jgi:hypothetical protein
MIADGAQSRFVYGLLIPVLIVFILEDIRTLMRRLY